MTERGSLAALPAEQPYPGNRRRTFSSSQATVAEYTFEPGARFPRHHHAQEQITLVQEGQIELTAAGRTAALGPGQWAVTAAGVEHGVRAGDRGARFLAILVPRRGADDALTVTDTPTAGGSGR
jgi:quercetin dioxygenase-like cupin family protein